MNKSHRNHSPHISVVMPVYNGACTIRETIDSILHQTHQDFELIICNDASTDETEDILNKITDARVHVIHNSHNMGPGFSRDRAIEMAESAWIAVIDADDTWRPDRLEKLISLADNTDKIIFDDIMRCHDTPSGMVPWQTLHGKHAFGGNGIDPIQVPVKKYICSESLLIKPLLPSSHIRQHSIRHTSLRYGEDSEFFLKLLAIGLHLYYIPIPMYNYRITQGSQSTSPERYSMMIQVIENSISLFENYPAVQDAMRNKIAMEKRKAVYLPLILSLKRKEFIKALQLLYQSPWIIADSFPRLLRALAYQIHRILHRGRYRGTL